MNVLSLFDGISCGRLALERAKIKVRSFWASMYILNFTENKHTSK